MNDNPKDIILSAFEASLEAQLRKWFIGRAHSTICAGRSVDARVR